MTLQNLASQLRLYVQYPHISAIYLKLKLTHQPFTEDEQDEYDLLSKKFSKQQFDLSVYYDNSNENDSDTTEIKLCKKSGLYGLEKIIYGGTV